MLFFALGALLLFVYFIMALIKPFEAILLAFMIKPILDMSYNIGAGGLTLGRVMSAFIIVHFSVCILLNLHQWSQLKLRYLIVLLIIVSSFSYVFTGLQDIMMGVELLLRYLNFLLPFLAIPFIIKRNESLFFKFLLIASALPILISVLQIAGIPIGHFESTIGGLVRPRGFFHDIFTNRLYFLYGMVGSSYLLIKGLNTLTKFMATIMFLLANFCMLCMFSKSGYIITALFVLLLFVHLDFPFRKIFAPMILVTGLLLIAVKSERLTTVYQKEINFLLGHERVERLFQGRVFGWLDAIEKWSNSSTFAQFFGQGDIASGMHNDFLRILFANGLLGLGLYLVFLMIVFVLLCSSYVVCRSFEFALALTLFMVFFVDSIGLVPTLYPAYNWMVWGIISYCLSFVATESQPKNGVQLYGSAVAGYRW